MEAKEVMSTRNETEYERIFQASLKMADEARYRPEAPGDGFGSVDLTKDQVDDPERLEMEAARYAKRFIAEESSRSFSIGVSDWSTNRALVYAVEAARALCSPDHDLALDLLKMAVKETGESKERRK